MEGSAYWTVVGGAVVALIAVLGNIAVKVYEKWSAREITLFNGNAELEIAHESRPWAEMGRRITDLKEEIERLEHSVREERVDNDRLREERERLRVEVSDWQIKAAQSAALKDQCEQERIAHHQIVERLRSEVARLRGEG